MSCGARGSLSAPAGVNPQVDDRVRCTAAYRFPVPSFRFYLTPSSRYFSSFDHSTCLLSVYRLYLAFPGAYPELNAEISISATRKHTKIHGPRASLLTGLSPSLASHSKELTKRPRPAMAYPYTTIRRRYPDADFKFGLCPLHSPLLWTSLLFSFPSLNKMLQLRE